MNKQRSMNLFNSTIHQWQPYYEGQLTQEETKEIGRNISHFFDILAEWESANQVKLTSSTNTNFPLLSDRKKSEKHE